VYIAEETKENEKESPGPKEEDPGRLGNNRNRRIDPDGSTLDPTARMQGEWTG
jgi:hypothetical protein